MSPLPQLNKEDAFPSLPSSLPLSFIPSSEYPLTICLRWVCSGLPSFNIALMALTFLYSVLLLRKLRFGEALTRTPVSNEHVTGSSEYERGIPRGRKINAQ